ncbi:hypothetical protein HXA31_17400 [Salipaludibacillus agaradhaerens]|jgi:hypothetical protein|uniref:Uncharacterized protein n=1 Tax=Salipaludibacillus agaradhaerens TaxID=76935 RepID=A0A9Q4G0P9_SALAG|nr:hypothetical protein [Salipaludibacillus agaradhaerens]MCR6098252.1 hypothetical protein [Salipaludibacillus agaradhaerens]MCR6116118.1 hypothetical protein [Salipaludibacillus agaradhaerens]
MNKTIIGIAFLFMASILYATQFICGAFGAIGASEWHEEEFSRYMSYVPNGLIVATVIALVFGIAFFVWGIIESFQRK